MACEQLPAGIDLRPDALGDAEDHAANQRPPKIAEPADDDRLETEDQPTGSHERIEIGADRQKHPRDRDDSKRKRHRGGIDLPVVEPHQQRNFAVVAGGAKRPAESRMVEQEL